jgi:DNA-binding response OmpR family regulator
MAASRVVLYIGAMNEHNENKVHILVVDDDAGLRELLADYLTGQGYAVGAVADGAEMEAFLAERPADLVILDLMLPGEDGLSLARRLRVRGNLPIIMLSARGEEIDRIVGLEVGADDYLAKPFNPRELLARIRAVLRRHGEPKESIPPASYCFGPFQFDPERRRLVRDGEEVALTSGEFALLRIFVEHANRVLSRDHLMDLIKGFERDPFDRSIDVRVTRLRRKMRLTRQSRAISVPYGGRAICSHRRGAQHETLAGSPGDFVRQDRCHPDRGPVGVPAGRAGGGGGDRIPADGKAFGRRSGGADGAVRPDLGRASARDSPGLRGRIGQEP